MRRVVWLNGAFGIGKSTVAELLAERLGDAIVLDPELIGAGLRAERAEWRGLDDFQNIPEWRDRTRSAVSSAVVEHGTVVVVMTVHRRDYFDETVGALRDEGLPLDHFTLVARPEVIRARLLAREGDNDWALDRVERCVSELAGPRFAVHVDASGSPASIANDLAVRLA
jgi:predicted kinase